MVVGVHSNTASSNTIDCLVYLICSQASLSLYPSDSRFFSLQEKFLFNDSIGVFNNHAYKSELSLKLDHTALASSTTAHDMARQVLAYISDGYLVPRGLNGTAACSEMWPDIVEACSDSSQSGFHRRAYVWAIVAIGGVVLGTLVLTCVLLALHKYYNVRREAVNVSHSVKLTTTL